MEVIHCPPKRVDFVGRTYGRLVVEAYHHSVLNAGGIKTDKWECKCECGKQRIVSSNNLVSGNTKSCGCLKKESNARKFRFNGSLVPASKEK